MRIGITIGDAAGIGPEVILKSLAEAPEDVEPAVFGDRDVLERTDELLSENVAGWESIRGRFRKLRSADSPMREGEIGIFDVMEMSDFSDLEWGRRHADAARLQLAAFRAAVDAARSGDVDAVVTAPWTKELFRLIDQPAVGHTEILAETFDASDHVMMLAGPVLRVALVTVHVPIAEVSEHITPDRLGATIRTSAAGLRERFGIDEPRLAVCGLNPHAGEHGVMGREESDVIEPTLRELRADLDDVTLQGPFPADTLFAQFHGGHQPYDAVICMYHDQGLIPLKLQHFGESANTTLGIPIVRTSVDHGSAYDIAGRGIADAGSMRYAIELARRQAERIQP